MKIVIFGASGDLAKRKIFPSLSKVYYSNPVNIIAYARSDLKSSFSLELRKTYDYKNDFPEQIEYIQGDYNDLSKLKGIIDKHTILYFSVPPNVYDLILSSLDGFVFDSIAIEKPYGSNIESFKQIISHSYKNIHFIDHYLLKPLMIALPSIYKDNMALFEFLSSKTVKTIKCHFLETLLAEGREYFDKTGIVKDVMQNHLIEVLASICCEKDDIKNLNKAREEFIRNLNIPQQTYYFGQYDTYQEDFKKKSNCETFAAFLCESNSSKWKGVGISMVAGKGLNRKATEVIFELKPEYLDFFRNQIDEFEIVKSSINKSELIFNIAPNNEIYLNLYMKSNALKILLYSAEEIEILKNKFYNDLKDYEIVFHSLICKLSYPSISCNEALLLWELFENINKSNKNLFFYEKGSDMSGKICLIDDKKE